nr:NEL-type E3 ubiquitin ligase domain-containing protein [uncultured Pseudomonas sp.]
MNTALTDQQLAEQACQDGLIAARLPSWLTTLDKAFVVHATQALKSSLACRKRLSARWASIEGIDTFAKPLLQKALRDRFGTTVDVDHLWFRNAYEVPLSTYAPIRVPLTTREYYQIPLLEAALRNFTADETQADGSAPGTGAYDPAGNPLPGAGAAHLAQLIRALDLGALYQRHLRVHLASAATQALLGELNRHEMLLDAFKASAQGTLERAELELLVELWQSGRLGRLKGHRVLPKRLQILDCPLQHILVLDVRDEALAPFYTASERVLVYIPGDPLGAWSSAENLERFARSVLNARLRKPNYQQFFGRFIRRRDSQAFFTQVATVFYSDMPAWATADLYPIARTLSAPLFETLAESRVSHILDDAATLAPPVDTLDRAREREHEQRLVAEGWTLLGLASFWLPSLGAILLGVAAWELLKEVYYGVDAWREGETEQGMDHLAHVATEVALIGATAGAGYGLGKAWKRSVWVDSLIQSDAHDNGACLWSGDLSPFRTALPPADAVTDQAGISHCGTHAWIRMDGHTYPVQQRAADDQWQLVPRNGVGPLLQHNGAGAWRLWSESPLDWSASDYLFRRLGGPMAELDDMRIAHVLAIHGLDDGQLRALHIRGTDPLPALIDTSRRAHLVQRIDTLMFHLRTADTIADQGLLEQVVQLTDGAGLAPVDLAARLEAQRPEVLQRLYDQQTPAPSAESHALQRMFPRLYASAAQALLDNASSIDLQRLRQTGRVPLQLAEAARARSLQIRVHRALESLLLRTPQDLDVGRLVVGLLGHRAGGLGNVRWRLFGDQAEGLQLASAGAGDTALDLLFANNRFSVRDGTGAVICSAGDLFQVIVDAYGQTQLTTLGLQAPFAENLRLEVAALAQVHRAVLPGLLGSAAARRWQMPIRLADGRVGYLLSGRGSRRPNPYLRRLRFLYPTYTDAQLDAWLNDAQAVGGGIEMRLQRLEDQYRILNEHLRTWTRQSSSRAERQRRQTLGQALRNCWQHVLDEGTHGDSLIQAYRWHMLGIHTESFPELPSQLVFDHVYSLALCEASIRHLPESFLRAFTSVRSLELPGNQLARVPMAVLSMDNLWRLDLAHNQIVLDAGQATILASCRHLRYLDLSRNPLGRPFAVGGLPHLHELRLAGTGLQSLPYHLLESISLQMVDLRDNQLTALPDGFYESRLWVQGQVHLSGNPLTVAERERLDQALSTAATRASARATGLVRLRWMDAIGDTQRTELSACWERLQAIDGSGEFFGLLERLMQTADFQHRAGARYLAARVLVLLRAMRDSSDLRVAMFNDAEQLTCQDSVALRFSDLELRLRVWQAEAQAQQPEQEQSLLYLGRQLWRMDEVERVAMDDVRWRQSDGANPDEIEVVLAYRLALRESLDLPILTSGMSFRAVAGVTDAHIERARTRVLQAETSEQLANSLVDREFWCRYLRGAHVMRFDDLNAPFHARLEAVQEATDLSELQVLQQTQDIAQQRQAAERALLLELTRQALDNAAQPMSR